MKTSQTNKNLKNTINILMIGANILRFISIFVVILSLITLGFGIIMSKDFLWVNFESISGFIQMNVSQSIKITFPFIGGDIPLKQLAWTGGLLGTLYGAFMYLVIHHFKVVLIELKESRPFDQKSYKALRVMSYLFIISAVLLPVFEFLFFSKMMNAITSHDINITIGLNINYIWIGLIIFVLSKVFEYGSFLQTSYDETV